MSKFCIKCGKELSDGIKFCTNCGTKIETQENYEVKPEPQENQQQNFNYTPNGKLKKIFGCDIKNNADYVKAEKSRKLYINIILICVAVTIILLPFYDKGYWFKPGIVKTLLDGMSALSIASKVVALPVCIIAFIKYNFINKELIKYLALNPNLTKQSANMKKSAIVLFISLIICLVMTPVMDKVNTVALHKNLDDNSNTSSTETSSSANSSYKDNGSTEYSTRSETTANKYKKDDDFIIEYLEKINYGFDYTIEDTDEYNRYIISGVAKKGFEHVPNQLIVYLVWIDEDDNVDGKQKEATREEQKTRLISEMHENPLWNAPPLQ